MNISQIQHVTSGEASSVAGVQSSRGEFASMLNKMLQAANRSQTQADTALVSFVSGQTSNVQDVAVSLAKAEMSFGFMMEVRNRVVDTYHDLMRMQV